MRISRLLYSGPDINIIEMVSIGMPQYDINIIQGNGIRNLKCNIRFYGRRPFMIVKCLIFFKNTGGPVTGRNRSMLR